MNAHNFRSLIQRRHVVPLALALSVSLVALCGLSYSRAQEQEPEEREVVEKIPKHLPIKVKIKKPEKLKDAKNEDWLDDMEIEVTNTGTKPIYCLSISLWMPDVRHENGTMYGFRYKLGRIALVDLGEPIQPDDVPLRPGETVILNPPANNIEGWRSLRKKGRVSNPKKLEFVFQVINFGDGTGFVAPTGIPLPRRRSSNDPRTRGGGSGVRPAAAGFNAHPDADTAAGRDAHPQPHPENHPVPQPEAGRLLPGED